MAGIKGRSGRRDHSTGEKSGRKFKENTPKNKILFGCRYTQEEFDKMNQIIEEFKVKGMTKSEVIYLAICNLKNLK